MKKFWLAAVFHTALTANAYELVECEEPQGEIASAVCEDANLVDRNQRLYQTYRSVAKHGDRRQIAHADKLLREFIKERDRCHADTECLRALYGGILAELIDFHNDEVIDSPCLIIGGNHHTENACAAVRAKQSEQALTVAFEEARERIIEFHRGQGPSKDQIQQFREAQQDVLDAWRNWRDAQCNLLLMPGFAGQGTTDSYCLLELNEQRIREYESQSGEPY